MDIVHLATVNKVFSDICGVNYIPNKMLQGQMVIMTASASSNCISTSSPFQTIFFKRFNLQSSFCLIVIQFCTSIFQGETVLIYFKHEVLLSLPEARPFSIKDEQLLSNNNMPLPGSNFQDNLVPRI